MVLLSDNQYQQRGKHLQKDHIYWHLFRPKNSSKFRHLLCDSNSIEAYALNGFALDCNGLTITNGCEWNSTKIVLSISQYMEMEISTSIFSLYQWKINSVIIHQKQVKEVHLSEISTKYQTNLRPSDCENKSMGLARFVIETVEYNIHELQG